MRTAALLGLLLAACAAPPPPPPPAVAMPELNLSGFPPEFQAGYRDGCATAQGKASKDEQRYRKSRQYALGWGDGRDICKRQAKR